jgi:mRNA interferase MazF
MRSITLKIARIGNSKGIRLPADVLRRYRIGSVVLMEEKSEGIFLRPSGRYIEKLSWADTAAEMSAAGENWSEWDSVADDGLEILPWDKKRPGSVTEKSAAYGTRAPQSARRIKRYEIRWAGLDPARGAEMSKSRPVVIVSLDELNDRLQTVTVCPLTTQLHPAWRSRLPVDCAGQAAEVAVDQIRTISRSRLGKKIGSLSDDEASALRRLITEMYGE